MSVDMTELLANIIVSLLGLAGLWLVGQARALLKSRMETEQAGELDKLIYELVAAAEQTLKASDPDGHIRKQYVMEMLSQFGIEVNKEILARIESAVWAINLEAHHGE